MTSSGNNPSLDPANNDTLAGTMQFVFNKMMQSVNNMLPARVIAFDRAANRVQVELLITILTSDGSQVPRGQIASLPVLLLGGGGFMLNFNLQSGDLGWVVANDRDISLFLTSYAQSPPNTTRLHDFADGLFIPDVMTGYTIASEDVSNAVLQSLDGTVKISFNSAQIKIQAPAVIIEGATTVDGALTATAGITVTGGGSTPFNVTGDMLLTGNLRVVGNITASGDITPFVP